VGISTKDDDEDDDDWLPVVLAAPAKTQAFAVYNKLLPYTYMCIYIYTYIYIYLFTYTYIYYILVLHHPLNYSDHMWTRLPLSAPLKATRLHHVTPHIAVFVAGRALDIAVAPGSPPSHRQTNMSKGMPHPNKAVACLMWRAQSQ